METIEQRYQRLCRTPTDINEHLPTLNRYARACNFVMEFGVCSAQSTTAFLAAQPLRLVSAETDHNWNPALRELSGPVDSQIGVGFRATVGRTEWEFINKNDLDIPQFSPELLFIDSWHREGQMKAELEMHAPQVKRWIICHDTATFCWLGERIRPDDPIFLGIGFALVDYLRSHPEWKIRESYNNNNGLLVLERIS